LSTPDRTAGPYPFRVMLRAGTARAPVAVVKLRHGFSNQKNLLR